MVGVDEALTRVLAAVQPLPPVEVPMLDALGLVLASDVVATADLPPFRNAAMDGYAVRASDTAGATAGCPAVLKIVGEIAAGSARHVAVTAGTAARIMTGAPIPLGADAVVRFEETSEADVTAASASRRREVAIHRGVRSGDNIRCAGEDVRYGETALTAGMRVRPVDIGLLAALGRQGVSVHRRPRVAILATGDEVIAPGAVLQPGQIRDSNSLAIAAMVRRYGGEPLLCGIARDATDDLRSQLLAARSADLIVTSGGVSLGDYDIVKDVLRAEGAIAIWQVRMKPGKPLAFGTIDGTPLLGLPGNPVAAAVSFLQFGRPAILRFLGRKDLAMPTVEATLSDRIENRGGCRHYVRVIVDGNAQAGYTARLAGNQGAGMLTSLIRASGLAIVQEDIETVQPGMRLMVQMIDWDIE